jgi:hypothetical protein
MLRRALWFVVREVRQCDGKYYSWEQLALEDAPVGRMYTASVRMMRHASYKYQGS